MERRADLHTHTTYSDGVLTPYELITKAKAVGVGILGITDHDSVSGLEEAAEIGKEFDVEIVPGLELSASTKDAEVHILGYFIDYHRNSLLEALAVFREQRVKRAERIVGKLNKMNIPLKIETVLEGARGSSVGRPHIASALVSEGHAESYRQAFDKFLGNGRPAYEKKTEFSPEDTVQLIADAGGLSFIAHPGRSIDEVRLTQLIKAGLDGIEVTHPSHSPERVEYYRGIVSEYCLLESGGSDYHGGLKNDEEILGKVTISAETVDAMRRRLVSRQ